jgi:hypothetical protein
MRRQNLPWPGRLDLHGLACAGMKITSRRTKVYGLGIGTAEMSCP